MCCPRAPASVPPDYPKNVYNCIMQNMRNAVLTMLPHVPVGCRPQVPINFSEYRNQRKSCHIPPPHGRLSFILGHELILGSNPRHLILTGSPSGLVTLTSPPPSPLVICHSHTASHTRTHVHYHFNFSTIYVAVLLVYHILRIVTSLL